MGKSNLTKIVVSAVNFNEGGPLSVLNDCLASLDTIARKQNIQVTVLVHKVSLVKKYAEYFNVIEFPQIKSSWFRRVYFEYFQCRKLEKIFNPDLWIALHDMTPIVTCKQVVYCHNPAPFYSMKGNELFTDPTFFLFCLFYKFLYRINIKKNEYVIVQQQWLREEFERNYKVKTIVAYPVVDVKVPLKEDVHPLQQKKEKFTFFYPAFPRVPKNFQVLLESASLLSKKRTDFNVILSITGNENRYATNLFNRYQHVKEVKFDGKKKREEIFELYNEIDCMVFPSKLETWGLPISEFKNLNKPMLLADLRYAHETAANCSFLKFFNPDDPVELANYMEILIDDKLTFDSNKINDPDKPFFNNWDKLIAFLIQ
ncbi:glycosyltransferase [Mucilaginibacter kameinonensis]|uniref:glycosyltransferase n=1 Tax=Mucilaginibacter kameinonensis TaxID=452286 RepID=UPI000EF7E21C|nr:glycosyltransferase [Mucilaginibacter kameinonensis]